MFEVDERRIFQADELEAVANALQSAQVLAYPSESVWGLGCDAFCDVALERIIELKHRPLEKGVIVLTDTAQRLQPLLMDLPSSQQQRILQRIHAFSDAQMMARGQAVTWLVPVSRSARLPKLLTGNHPSLAVRVTPHSILKQLCAKLVTLANPFGFLVSTSCNPSSEAPAKSFDEAWGYFGEKIAYLQADSLGFQTPSQIIDVITGEVVR